MNGPVRVSVCMAALMVMTSGLTEIITPTKKVVDFGEKIDLVQMVPMSFGDWQVDASIIPLDVSPEIKKTLSEVYDQTLSRTYVNRTGKHIMLSVAYGGDQSGNLVLHKPEVCYGVQGFDISNLSINDMATPYGNFPVTRLLATLSSRHEPITYWTTVGDKTIKNGFEQKLQKFRYALTGKIPDGMLVRVSAIDPDDAEAYRLQKNFIDDLLSAISPKDRVRFIGKPDA